MSVRDLPYVDLDTTIQVYREFYLELQRRGITIDHMAEVTGEPAATFNMWLRGYRDIKKLSVLTAIMNGASELDFRFEELTNPDNHLLS